MLDISGTGEYRAAGGMTVGANGTLNVHDGGRLVAKSISTSKSTAKATFDGGTVVLTNITDGASLFGGFSSITVGAGGLTLDTAGYDVTMATASGANVLASDASTFTKAGNGTLSISAVPPVGNMVVSNGTLSLSASCDNASMLAHRWSFTSDLTDSVTGAAGTGNWEVSSACGVNSTISAIISTVASVVTSMRPRVRNTPCRHRKYTPTGGSSTASARPIMPRTDMARFLDGAAIFWVYAEEALRW